jgi:hypothetical protein
LEAYMLATPTVGLLPSARFLLPRANREKRRRSLERAALRRYRSKVLHGGVPRMSRGLSRDGAQQTNFGVFPRLFIANRLLRTVERLPGRSDLQRRRLSSPREPRTR